MKQQTDTKEFVNIILKEILEYFNIKVELPEYLYTESFNDVFKNGMLTKTSDEYKIVVETRKEITHTLIIREKDKYPVIIQSELKNGTKNGFKFGLKKGEEKFIGDKL